jgi:predicted 3-demethylubiquinone-9 3-methyltransferase (glyoxalase superfamily)
MQKITPFLWFENHAEEAADLYTTVFPDAKIVNKTYWPEGTPQAGTLITATVSLFGQDVVLLNGAPANVKFTEAASYMVSCDTQEEIDSYWDQLIADGGEPSQCGWLKDKFGVSWQITPSVLLSLISDPDQEKAGRAMGAMMQMSKLDIATLEAAYKGE